MRSSLSLSRSSARCRRRCWISNAATSADCSPITRIVAMTRLRCCSQRPGGRNRISLPTGSLSSLIPKRCSCRQSKTGRVKSPVATGIFETSSPSRIRSASRAVASPTGAGAVTRPPAPPWPMLVSTSTTIGRLATSAKAARPSCGRYAAPAPSNVTLVYMIAVSSGSTATRFLSSVIGRPSRLMSSNSLVKAGISSL